MSPLPAGAKRVPGANVIIQRFDITASDGWVKLSNESLIANVTLKPKSTDTIKIRFRGGTEALLPSGTYELREVDLSELEISTTNVGTSSLLLIAQPTRS